MSGFLSSGIEPSLIHAIEIQVRRLDKVVTVYDPVYREPVSTGGPTYKAIETVLGQVKWFSKEDLGPTPGGNDDESDGYFLMLKSDVDDLAGGAFQIGDKVVNMDGTNYINDPLYIVQPFKSGHYTAEAKLYKFFFRKRDKVAAKVEAGTRSATR